MAHRSVVVPQDREAFTMRLVEMMFTDLAQTTFIGKAYMSDGQIRLYLVSTGVCLSGIPGHRPQPGPN